MGVAGGATNTCMYAVVDLDDDGASGLCAQSLMDIFTGPLGKQVLPSIMNHKVHAEESMWGAIQRRLYLCAVMSQLDPAILTITCIHMRIGCFTIRHFDCPIFILPYNHCELLIVQICKVSSSKVCPSPTHMACTGGFICAQALRVHVPDCRRRLIHPCVFHRDQVQLLGERLVAQKCHRMGCVARSTYFSAYF